MTFLRRRWWWLVLGATWIVQAALHYLADVGLVTVMLLGLLVGIAAVGGEAYASRRGARRVGSGTS